ncbi:efflux transporter outer membrane subunit [Burkholderia multivorans]|uniref:efflux transporter outer membrane subunit n=2 Tax=Burkholderia multivorans TaxID=87883 RepID=UPI0020A1A2A9|nr:efflux transporter outer membrane subunit [Burkholderia multivorans]MCO8318121.1 efflux transporter outer membrane subunit [Burkholderia multivorans]MCO8550455.1 efflux transporter outer membrane subunit [Burkholderia multivorans]MCO8557863.1 efflux transporter outer membrane subunit [Burkholderia multivorans]MCO8621435.1 efflux transporter outer membrane subunit [Burkholderia multivorans]
MLLMVPLSTMLTSCMVGPDFHRPANAMPAQWKPVADTAGTPSQPVPATIDPDWWKVFGDAELTSLVDRVTTANLDVRVASSRLRQSRAERQAIAADAEPHVEADAAYRHARASSTGLVDPSGEHGEHDYNVWQAGFDASWELDLWGRVRREVESADATIEASADARRGVLLSVCAETARNYIQLRAVQARQALLDQAREVARQRLELVRIRFTHGAATQVEVADAALNAAQIEARLPPLQQQQAHLVNALSFLLGAPPRALEKELDAPAPIPPVPSQVPVGLPSQLVEQRPDIRQAEATLHAAIANVGVAIGDFYPRITLSGDLGSQALQLSDLGTWGSRTFAIGPAISLPIFEGGRLHSVLTLRQAQQQQAAIQYQQTVLRAWHEVDDGLTDYAATQRRLNQLDQTVTQSQQSFDDAQRRYSVGLVDLQQVLATRQALLTNRDAAISGTEDVSLALVALYKSLGGGWQAGT